MSRTLGVVEEALDRTEVMPFFAVELMFDTAPLYLWTGIGDLTTGGITYTGTGNIMSISEIRETADISAAGATITLSGIASDVLSLALTEPYQGRLARIKFGIIDANQDLLITEGGDYILTEGGDTIDVAFGDPTGLSDLFVGYMDQMNIDENAGGCTIGLAVESKLIALERPVVQRYTSESQKARFAGDLAFDFVNDLQDKQLTWGRGS